MEVADQGHFDAHHAQLVDDARNGGSVKQDAGLWRAASGMGRLIVNNVEYGADIPRIDDKLRVLGVGVPLIGAMR
ncbi:hypothetical protein [Xanthomonas euvesicatoria]|uniref:hypothetical protein n=1 Tax=Xanthomonas euvesicatoria TaxID=456327 RepID=UPI0038926F04